MKDQWRGFVLSYFFQLEALSDISTVITETVPKSQGVNFRNTMNCAGFLLILQLAKPLLRLTEVPARIERSPAGRGMMTCHTCRATESGRGSGCPHRPRMSCGRYPVGPHPLWEEAGRRDLCCCVLSRFCDPASYLSELRSEGLRL